MNPNPEHVFTTWHSISCSIIFGTKLRMPLMTPHRFTLRTHCQSFSVAVVKKHRVLTPALLNNRCTAPNPLKVLFARVSICITFDTSNLTALTSAPLFFKLASSSNRGSSSTSTSTTFIPSLTHLVARAFPIPLAAPVTTATLFLKSFI